MNDIAEYLSMGGYGGFIWSAYGITIFVVAVLIAANISAFKRADRALRDLKVRRGRRAKGGEPA